MEIDSNTPSKTSNSVKGISISILLISFFLIIASIFAVPHLQTQYSLKQFLPSDNPLLRKDQSVRELFQLPEIQPFIITAKLQNPQDTWLTQLKIQSLEALEKRISHLPGVKDTISLPSIQGAVGTSESLNVGPLLKNLPVDQWSSEVLKNPLITPTLISKDTQTTAMIVDIEPLKTQELLHLRQSLASISQDTLHFAKVDIGGTPAVQTDVGLLLQSEIRNFVGLGFLGCFLILALIFSNGWPLVISFIIVFCANIFTLAVLALAGYPFSILSSTIPIIVTVDVVSLCIHTLLRVAEEQKKQPNLDHHRLVNSSLKILLGPNLLASTTTMIGFLALLTVKVPLIRDYGISAAIAIVIGWLTTTVLLYPLLHFFPAPRARDWAWARARWSLYLFRRPSLWVLGTALISFFLAFKGQNLSWSARLFDDLPQQHQVRLATETIDKELGGMVPIDLQIKGAPDIWNDPKVLGRLDSFLEELRNTSHVGGVVGLPDLVAATHLHQNRLPASRSSLAEVFFLYSLTGNSPLKNFLTTDSATTRISLRLQDIPGNEMQHLLENIERKASTTFPEMSVEITGLGSTIHQLNNSLSHELIFGFWQSLAAIGLLLVFVFRSLRWALVACLPNLVPPAALLGFLALSETPIKPSVAIIFSIALGLAFNNTVYLLERLRALQKSSGSHILKTEKTFWLESNPCLISTLTLLAGFSVFLASYFSMNRIFGFYMVLSMLAGLVGDLILLPTLLKRYPWLLQPLSWKKKNAMAKAGIILCALTFSLSPRVVNAQVTLEKINHETSQRLKSRDEQFTVTMKIIEADGSSKERQMQLERFSPQKKEHSLLVRILKPQDLKGTALLATMKNDKEDRWIYLPSSKQTRRLTGESGQGGILGSELSTEDFDFNREGSARSELKKEITLEGKKFYVVESDVNATSETYSRLVSYVTASQYLPARVECYDKKGKLLKVLDITNYKKITATQWRAGKINIRNLQNKRKTELSIFNIKLNQQLDSRRFTPKSLAED